MPPLILHNVPDEELYVGDDGVQRPYAMLFPGHDHPGSLKSSRRTIAETGSFGKSTRRSRSRTGTPAAKKEDPTIQVGDQIFSAFLQKSAASRSESPQRRNSVSASAQSTLSSNIPLGQIDGNAGPNPRYVHKEPTEVILRGFKSSHQYAAIREYERIGGRICEDYPRDPPIEERRYKSDLRDPATLRQRALTLEEKAKALKFAGGEHWIKVTFESHEAAERAIDSSPQSILGYVVYAELYRGAPPANDEAIRLNPPSGSGRHPSGFQTSSLLATPRQTSALPRSWTTPSMSQVPRGHASWSPEGSHTSSHTLDTATLSTATASSRTITEAPHSSSQPEGSSNNPQESIFCRKIPTAKRLQLLPAEQALLPQKSYSQRVISNIPLIRWFSADIIGNQVPTTEAGEFDWARASLYWKVAWWFDSIFGCLDIVNRDE